MHSPRQHLVLDTRQKEISQEEIRQKQISQRGVSLWRGYRFGASTQEIEQSRLFEQYGKVDVVT
ncbi:MAG: hypothetical protein ACREET_08145, partial [Stellaceae bacterium]